MDFKIIHDFEIIQGNCIAVIKCGITKTITNRLTFYEFAKKSFFSTEQNTGIKIVGVWRIKKQI